MSCAVAFTKGVFVSRHGGCSLCVCRPEFPKGVIQAIVDNLSALLTYTRSNPETTGIAHGDTRLDNYFFYSEDGVRKVLCLELAVH